MNREEKILCKTPTLGKKPTRIEKWKYHAIRKAILRVLPRTGEGLLFMDLSGEVKKKLSKDIRQKMGSVSWYTPTVKLALEVRGEIKRVPGSKPQRLKRTEKNIE